MRRFLPLVIIGTVFCLALGGGWLFLQWKQQHQPSPTSPIPPIEETAPAPVETPSPSETPRTTEAQATPEPRGTPEPQATPVPQSAVAATPEPLHIRGNPKAKVTLEEYGDFQCQSCGRLYPVIRLMEQDYGDRLRVIFRHMPLNRHELAPLAARAAEAAGLQGRFWEMHDLLFENSPRWTKGVETVGPDAPPSRRLESNVLAMDIEVRDVLFHYAEILHLDVERFKQDLDSDPVKARVESDHARALKLGIDRTPTIYVNGQYIPAPSSLTVDGLRAAIDAALAGKAFVPPPTPSPSATSLPKK